jgi:hypothetical protein
VCQHLDDICAASSACLADKLVTFDQAFQDIADSLGIALAPRDDPEKSFGPSTNGTVFGIHYDTVSWTWAIPKDKLANIYKQINNAIAVDTMDSKAWKSLAGKLIHIKPLVPAGRFNIDKIMATYAAANKDDFVKPSSACKRQLEFWKLFIQVCSGRIAIPRPVGRPAVGALQAYTDAAGGSCESIGRGTGGVMGAWWFYVPWPKRVNAGGWKIKGKKVSRKLSALELIGPLIVVAAGHQLCRGQNVNIWVDNASSVQAYNKGYSRSCPLCTTIVKALSTVAAGFGMTVNILKITRCSEPGAKMADALSKARFSKFRHTAAEANWPLQTDPASIPATLLKWIDRPTVTDSLGHSILREISSYSPIPGYSLW